MENHLNDLFVSGCWLSLDESIFRTFVWMKFKFGIIKKNSSYGIKTYFVMDADTTYVIKSVFYTGQATVYSSTTNALHTSKIRVVKYICEKFTGTYHTTYINRFYIPIYLLIYLYDMLLFYTGRTMKNPIPNYLTMKIISLDYKQMSKG